MLPEAVTCKVCGGETVFLCRTSNEHSRTSELSNFRCRACGLVFVGDTIVDEELAEAYRSQDTALYYEETSEQTALKFRSAIENLDRLLDGRRDVRLIDVGSGNGQFPHLLHEAGFTDVSVHDIPGNEFRDIEGLEVRRYADFDYGSIPDGTFDVVTLMDVAEHVVDPLRLFRQCHRILDRGGLVYFHTPVVTRVDRIMHAVQKLPAVSRLGRIWQRGRTSIFHLQNYSVAALRQVLGEAGFTDVRVERRNELSWPVSRFVRVFVCEMQGLPTFLAPPIALLAYPFLATDFFNPNKGIVWARKPSEAGR